MNQFDFEIGVDCGRGSFPTLPPGNALFSVTLDTVPSYNRLLYENRSDIKKAIGTERAKGYEMGLALGKTLKIPLKTAINDKSKSLRGRYRDVLSRYVTDKRLFCLVKVWRERSVKDASKASRKRDIYNLAIKALIDGLTDAGVWADDNEEYHTDFWITYKGVADTPKIIIKFYELED